MKTILAAILSAAIALAAFGRPASTHFDPNAPKHIHGVGYRCHLCGQTWGAIPKGLKAWEVRHLIKVRKQVVALHMRLIHHQ